MGDQRLLVPAYLYPSGSRWQDMSDAVDKSRATAVFIMNPHDGPGRAVDPNYRSALAYCHSKRQAVIGYVYTNYCARALRSVKADVNRYFRLYPEIEGIFIDQMSNQAAPKIKTYYRKLYTHIRAKSASALVVGNPGAAAFTPWQLGEPVVADLLVVFESSAKAYRDWLPPEWVRSWPAETFGHMVYGSRNAGTTTAICATSRQRHAGWIYVTDGVLDNPWDTPPNAPLLASPTLHRRSVSDG
jgi:hypothetical protein